MAVTAKTVETYAVALLREDLQEAFSMISPEETPFLQICKTKDVTQPKYDWPTAELAAPNSGNRVSEGESGVPNDDATLGIRWENITQISDKVVEVSHTAQKADAAAGNMQTLDKQRVLKMKELRRDMEVMLTSNVIAISGATNTARQTAGIQAWIKTNTIRGVGGTPPVFSGPGGVGGRPSTAAGAGTTVVFSEDSLNDVIEKCWNAGAAPSIILLNGTNKRRASKNFTGNATRYKDAIDKQIVAGIDIYDSDFGELTLVPTRFLPALNAGGANNSFSVLVLDPEYLTLTYLDTVQSKPLAETGHSMRELIWGEYGLQVDNEAAHGAIFDTKNTLT